MSEWRWIASYRLIDDQVARAQQRATLTYQFTKRFRAGIEWNPAANDASALANVLVVQETKKRPALILGTSSDRIGTPDGQAYYATLSKNLEPLNGWPIAPYAGVAYGEFEDKWRGIGGLRIRFPAHLSSTLIYDGVNFHPTLQYTHRERHVFTMLWVDTQKVGISYSLAF